MTTEQNATQCYHRGELAFKAVIGANFHSVVQSEQNATQCYHRGELAFNAVIGANFRSVVQSERKATQCYHRGELVWGEMPLNVTLRRNWYVAKCHSVLPSGRMGTQCCEWSEFSLRYNREEMPRNVTTGAHWHPRLPLGRICTQC